MELTLTLPSRAIIPLLLLFMIFIGSTIHENELSLWESIELSTVSIFAFIIAISILRRVPAAATVCDDDGDDAENQFNESIKIIHQDEPNTVPETVKEGKKPLPVSKPQVDRISILDPILGVWKLQDKARAEAKAAAAAVAKEEKEAERLRNQKGNKNKSPKKKDDHNKESASRDPASRGNELIVYEEMFPDGPSNSVLLGDDNSIKDAQDESFSLQKSILSGYLATLEESTDAAFIEKTHISIKSFMEKLHEASPSKGSEIIEAEGIKAPIGTIKKSPLSRPKIEWGGPKLAMARMKQPTPVGLSVGFGFLTKEHKLGEFRKVVSTPLRFKGSTKDDKIVDTIIKIPIGLTGEPVKEPECKNNEQEQAKLEFGTSQKPHEQPTEVMTAPVVNEVKETQELEKLFSSIIPGEKEVSQTARKILRARPRKTNSQKAWGGSPKSAKVSKAVLTPLALELEKFVELEESQTDQALPTAITPPTEQSPTEATVESVEIVVVPALAVEAQAVDNVPAGTTLGTSQEHIEVTVQSIETVTLAVEAQFLEDLPPKAPDSEDIPDQNDLEVLEISSPDLAKQLSAALEELGDISSLQSLPQSTTEQEQRPVKITFDDSDNICQEFLKLMNGSNEPKHMPERQDSGEISTLDCNVPQLIIDSEVDVTEQSSGQAFETVGVLTANNEQATGDDDDLMSSLQNFDDSSSGVISLEDLNFITASNEDSAQLSDQNFDHNFGLDENIDFDSIFSEILENGGTLPEHHMDVYLPVGIYTNGQENIADQSMSETLSFDSVYTADARVGGQEEAVDQIMSEALSFGNIYGEQGVADQIMSEALPSINIPAASGMEIDETELSEEELFRQALLAAETNINGGALVSQTQVVAKPVVNFEPQNQESGIGLSEGDEFLRQALLAAIAVMDRDTSVGQTQVAPEPAATVPGPADGRLQNQNNEDMLRQALLGDTVSGQTQTAPERVFAVPVPVSIRSQKKKSKANNDYQFGMPQDGFVPSLDTSKFTAWPGAVQNLYGPEAKYNLVVFPHQSFMPKQPVEQPIPVSAASNTSTTEPTTGQASFKETASSELNIQDTALFLLELTQGALAAEPSTEPAEPQETFTPKADVGLIPPRMTEKTLTPEPLTPVAPFQESFIPQLTVDQSAPAAITQKTLSPQLTTTQSTLESVIEQSSSATQLLDTSKPIQPQPLPELEAQVFQVTNVPQPILGADNGVWVTTNAIKLDTPTPSLDTCTNSSCTFFTPQRVVSSTDASLVNIDGMKIEAPQEFTQSAMSTNLALSQYVVSNDDASSLTIDGMKFKISQTLTEPVIDVAPSPPSTPQSISSTDDASSITTTDEMELEIPQMFTEPITNPNPLSLIFTLKATEKTSSKRRVEDESDDEENTNSMIDVKASTNRPTIRLRQKGLVLPVATVKIAPETKAPKKPISTSGIKIIMTAPTEPGSEIALKKRTKTHAPTVPDEPQVEPNYDCAKVNMQKELNKTTTKLQAAAMGRSITVARQRGMEIDDNGFFQLGPKNKPRRRC